MALKTVFLTEDIPFPISGSARARKSQLIRLLAEKTEVEVLCFDGRRLSRESLGIPEEVALTAIERDHEPFWRRFLQSVWHPLMPSQFDGLSEAMIDGL